MAGQYDNRERFIARLQPIIDRQLEIYRDNPGQYVQELPEHMRTLFVERSPSMKISQGCLLAQSLLATHRLPTAEYIWRLMNDGAAPPRADGFPWQPLDDDGLSSLMS